MQHCIEIIRKGNKTVRITCATTGQLHELRIAANLLDLRFHTRLLPHVENQPKFEDYESLETLKEFIKSCLQK